MISTKSKEDKVEQLFQQYIKLEHEDRSTFMNKVTRWLINKVEESNKELHKESK